MKPGSRVLNAIESIGNRLPDPVFLFLWFIVALIVLSLVGAGLGWSAAHASAPSAISQAWSIANIVAVRRWSSTPR